MFNTSADVGPCFL
uniref:Uncharacterized protein n=1 Tax=Anguilla anguilla TaxID=7936 RepID=A0A0E9XB27_ANGAN